MGCGCGKKNNATTIHFMGQNGSQMADPIEWGPVVWKYLHCLAEKVGTSGNSMVDTDLANHIETLINTMHLILPCTECQGHAAAYISATPLQSLKGLSGVALRDTVRNWLFSFHNAVRERKGQEIMIKTPDECAIQYVGCFVPKCEYNLFVQSVAFAVRQGWVRIDNWRKWYSYSERIRILAGNVVA